MSDDLFTPTGWNPDKVATFRSAFEEFLTVVWVSSKELGRICLGDHVYRAQEMFLDGVFDGLAQDIHWFDCLKSRQLGISTIARALVVFWLGVHDGLKGYEILDTDGHKEEARLEILSMIENLPKRVKFPRIRRQNRTLLELENGSLLNFASGGVKQAKGSGTLGRSSGVNLCHVSEMCSIDNPEGIEAFINSLAEDFPNRFYLWESTARGFNQRKEMWDEALEDTLHKKTIFIGWWAKDNQVIKFGTPDFERYGAQEPTQREIEKIEEVERLYGWRVTPEQLAWIRRKMDPTAKPEGDAPAEYVGSNLRVQEQPWTAEDAYQQTGASFFDPVNLTTITNKFTSKKFKTYSYSYGTEFIYCKVYPAPNARSVELKVWEEPDEDGYYVVACDPAYGHSEKSDRSAIQVLRCYADGVDQVAEYAWPLVNSRQLAWVAASLLAWYAGDKAEVYFILELNGPGEAVWNEFSRLKQDLQTGYQVRDAEDRGLRRIWTNVRNYVYTRSDSMSAGRNWQWKTNGNLKVTIFERLRDFVSNEMCRIRSLDTLEEMKSITREGDEIAAQGSKKDDRVFAMALAIRMWEERVRRQLSTQKRTRENELARKRLTIKDQAAMFHTHQLETLFKVKRVTRQQEQRIMRRLAWRGR